MTTRAAETIAASFGIRTWVAEAAATDRSVEVRAINQDLAVAPAAVGRLRAAARAAARPARRGLRRTAPMLALSTGARQMLHRPLGWTLARAEFNDGEEGRDHDAAIG